MLFHPIGKHLYETTIPSIKIENTTVERVKTFNFLGFTIDEHLSWKDHIAKISSKIGRVVGVMSKLKRIIPAHSLKLMYNSLIIPHLNYGITLWGHRASGLNKLQKKAIRILTKSKYNAHTMPLLKQENLLSIEDIYKLNCLKFYHKYKNSNLPDYFHNFFQRANNYNTRNTLPDIPHSRTNLCKNRIRHYVPVLLRNSPISIISKVDTHSLHGFTEYVKRYYISQYNPICSIRNCYICNNN